MGVFTPARRKLALKASFAVVVLAASAFTLARATAATTYTTVQPGTFAGSAFDACAAPASASMKAWKKASPYKGIGIYIGGSNRGCAQPNLTPAWVKEQVTAGWKLLPLYVGPQATCTTVSSKKSRIDNAHADSQGRTTAADAAAKAAALGLARQTVIIYDLEAYTTGDAACVRGILGFMNGWTQRLHELGYLSGFYSSLGSGVADQVANYDAAGYTRPDYLDFARWDEVSTVTDPAIPATYWPPHRRMKQYRGGHPETWGGVKINIDSNLVDFAPLPSARMADFDGSGFSDVLAKNWTTGTLYLYPGNGTTVAPGLRRSLGTGWNSMNAILRIGDLNRDGREDVVARQGNGDVWLYPGTGTGLGTRKKVGAGWGVLSQLTPVGDLTKDGYPDLVAVQGGKLFLYPGASGVKFGARKQIGAAGWGNISELAGVGDFNNDGYNDLVGRETSTGVLWVWAGGKGTIGGRTSLGTGWSTLRDVVGVGDFNRDGYADIAAIRPADNGLLLFPGTGKALKPAIRLATLAAFSPMA
jgi:glycoside hydrolase-like protein/VCBS repeat protein